MQIFVSQLLPGEDGASADSDWTCRKCTLVNAGTALACIVCGGSKLRSISTVQDMTLRKGEFWTCPKCTLRNPLRSPMCLACKTDMGSKPQSETGSAPQRSPSPRHHGKLLISTDLNVILGFVQCLCFATQDLNTIYQALRGLFQNSGMEATIAVVAAV